MTTEQQNTVIGCVKWFNNKTGFGFITVRKSELNPELIEKEIFVHHSAISGDNQQYKYLVQGEYVEFDLVKIEENQNQEKHHELQAKNVRGLYGGKIMCETRQESKILQLQLQSKNFPDIDENINIQTSKYKNNVNERTVRQRPVSAKPSTYSSTKNQYKPKK